VQDKQHDQELPEAGQPANPSRRKIFQAAAAVGLSTTLPAASEAATAAAPKHARAVKGSLDAKLKEHVKNVVVIYLENRSFNNLFADFPGLAQPLASVPADATAQKDRDGSVLPELPKIWGGMVPARQNLGGKDYIIKEDDIQHLPNAPFKLSDAQGKPLPEGIVTRDLVHQFYHNQMQINGGRNDGFVAWGDSGGMVMGHYGETAKNLGLYQIAREFTLCDNFFMAAFGGSYLNHQFLISGRTPEFFNAAETPAKKKIAVLEDGPQGVRLAVAPDSPKSALEGKPKFVNTAPSRRTATRSTPWPRLTSRAGCARRRAATPPWPTRRIRPCCRRRPTKRSATCCPTRRSAGPGMAAPGRRRWTAAAKGRARTSSTITSPSTTSSSLPRAPRRARSISATAAWATARSRTSSSPTWWPAACRRSASTSRRAT
jgi:hypothetical protein